MSHQLLFSEANSKLQKLEKRINKKIYSLDLVAGWSCPFAKDCKSKVVGTPYGLKVRDGLYTKFRCFSASQEAMYSHVFLKRLKNYQTIKELCNRPIELTKCINSSIPVDCEALRFHVSGDFFSKNYFKAAISVAINNPSIMFYAYTKAIRFWFELYKSIPDNFRLTASIGGTQDVVIQSFMRTVRVVKNKDDAKRLGLSLDNDDYHAYKNTNMKNPEHFALLIHGVQPTNKKDSLYEKVL
jgi:hypothetical protein